MLSQWSSPVNSSRVLRFVSGMSSEVKMPTNLHIRIQKITGTYMNNAKISMTWFNQALVPPLFLRGPIKACAMMAPTLPDAALIPCPVERYLVGNTSPGTMNVVVLGPKFWKKLARQ